MTDRTVLPFSRTVTDDEIRRILRAKFADFDTTQTAFSDALVNAWRGSDAMELLNAAVASGVLRRAEQPKGTPEHECIECHAGISGDDVIPFCLECYMEQPHPEGCQCGGFDRNGSHSADEYVGYCASSYSPKQASDDTGHLWASLCNHPRVNSVDASLDVGAKVEVIVGLREPGDCSYYGDGATLKEALSDVLGRLNA